MLLERDVLWASLARPGLFESPHRLDDQIVVDREKPVREGPRDIEPPVLRLR